MNNEYYAFGLNEHRSRKKKRGESKNDKTTVRHRCYCAKQYLSYSALYLHIRTKHPLQFQQNKLNSIFEYEESFDAGGFKTVQTVLRGSSRNSNFSQLRPFEQRIDPHPFNFSGNVSQAPMMAMQSLPSQQFPFPYPNTNYHSSYMMPMFEPMRGNLNLNQPFCNWTAQKDKNQNDQPVINRDLFSKLNQKAQIQNKELQARQEKKYLKIIQYLNMYLSETFIKEDFNLREKKELELTMCVFIAVGNRFLEKFKGSYQVNRGKDDYGQSFIQSDSPQVVETLIEKLTECQVTGVEKQNSYIVESWEQKVLNEQLEKARISLIHFQQQLKSFRRWFAQNVQERDVNSEQNEIKEEYSEMSRQNWNKE